jgi:beta-glucosidase-like glycosyl hydrolase/CubicO group peptidase (beta-lactamase class C family)
MTMNFSKYLSTLLIFLISGQLLYSQQTDSREEHWVDSVLNSLTREEMIAQLMIVRANNPDQPYFDVIGKYIREYNIGGVTFFGGKPGAQALQTNAWQAIAKTPLFISIDGEWGPAMRLDSTLAFPYQMTLGAIDNDTLIYRMGLEVAKQCKALGIQFNFAPVVDINSNPSNPVIHMRSFGEDRQDVARKGIMYMKGMQDGGLLVTAKHFPGHGDTDTDSHSTLPLIPHSKERLDSVETYPFRALIQAGLDGIMIAHLNIPALEKTPGTASTLSYSIVTDYLRNELGFQGLIVTDALDMKGVTLNNAPGEIELEAFKAGNDILLLSGNVPLAISRISKAVAAGEISEDDLKSRCRRVLTYKYKAGLADWKPVDTEQLAPALNSVASELTARLLFEEAVTLLKNDEGLLPLTRLDTLNIASVAIGYGKVTPFQERLQYYAPVDNFALKKDPTDADISSLLYQLKSYNLVIISLQNTGIWGGSPYGISQQALKFLRQCVSAKQVVLDLFATPYALKLVEDIAMEALVLSYQDHPLMQDMSAQAIFGGIPYRGTLPVTASSGFALGTGIQTEATRLKYILPEEIGIEQAWLYPIDSIVSECIRKRVFPGCEVWAAKDGKVFYMESFGWHTYEKTRPVGTFDIYDLASLTKVAATTISIMKLEEEGKIDIDRKMQDYLPYLQNTSKGQMIIRELMAHQARLKPWIPFYKYTLKDEKPDTALYRSKPSESFPTRVAENLYLVNGYRKVIYDSIISSKFLPTNSYKYSDLGFYLLPDVIENVSGEGIDVFTEKLFYSPLGLSTTGFSPRNRFSLDRITPTEDDLIYRKQLVHGDVHDPGAAMLGGVSGHAGLFSNANDLGILSQMLIQGGSYAGEKYLDAATVTEYTSQQFPLNDNRRGVGFDRPLPEYNDEGPCCRGASQLSYGHTGFTGTYIWIDPAAGLTYIFLSNRVHPDAENNKLSNLRIRPKIHQVFYDAIKKSPNFGANK